MLDSLDYQAGIQALLPEWILLGVLTALLLLSWRTPRLQRMAWVVSLGGIVLSGAFLIWQASLPSHHLFDGTLRLDGLAVWGKGIGWLATLLFLLADGPKATQQGRSPEYYLLVIGMLFGVHFMCMAHQLMVMVIALEIVSVCAYLLVVHRRLYAESVVASLRFLLFGLFATGLSLYGLSWWYGMTGSLEMQALAVADPGTPTIYVFILGMLLAAFFFKITAIPFHFWVAEVYKRISFPMVALISTLPKVGGFLMLMRFWHALGDGPYLVEAQGLLLCIALLSLTYGNLAALVAPRFRSMMAFSGIAQAGFMLLALWWDQASGYQAAVFFLLIFTLMNYIGLVSAAGLLEKEGEDTLGAFAGRGTARPIPGILLTLSMAALTGLPPTAGFIAKWQVVMVFFEQNTYLPSWVWISVISLIVLNTVISLFYYFRPVVQAYFRPGNSVHSPVERFPNALMWGFIAFPLLLLGIWGFGEVLDLIRLSLIDFVELTYSSTL